MKKPAFTFSALCLMSSAAIAADMPMKAPLAPPAPVLSWAGFYIGGNGGYGWEHDPFNEAFTSNPLVYVSGFNSRGWIAGGQVGYNWQYGGFVGGLELDLDATGIKGSNALTTVDLGNGNSVSQQLGDDVKLLGSARGRVGWAISPDWLLYGTGGLGWERLNQITSINSSGPGFGGATSSTFTTPTNFVGWVLGAGVEYRLGQTNWIGRLEYLHYDFGHTLGSSTVVTTVPNNANTSSTAGDQTIDVVRVGLSYKFGN